MNYKDGTEVKLRDYVFIGYEGGRIIELKDDKVLVKSYYSSDRWFNIQDIKFNQRGAPDPTGITKLFIVKKWHWEVVLKLDTSLTPDDTFRKDFYNFYTLREMAEHIVWNRYRQGFKGQIEGLFEEQCEPPYLWIIYVERY